MSHFQTFRRLWFKPLTTAKTPRRQKCHLGVLVEATGFEPTTSCPEPRRNKACMPAAVCLAAWLHGLFLLFPHIRIRVCAGALKKSALGRGAKRRGLNRSTNKNTAERSLCGAFGRGDGIIFASMGKWKVEVFMRGSMASRPQASARVNRQPRIRRRISKRFGGCGSNPSQQQRPRDGRNAISGSWSRRRDLNPRPLGPEPSALPNCATPRTVNIISNRTHFCKRF